MLYNLQVGPQQYQLMNLVMVDQQTIELDLETQVLCGGVAAATINFDGSSGYLITKVDDDNYTFATGTTSSITETGGGGSISAGPVFTVTGIC